MPISGVLLGLPSPRLQPHADLYGGKRIFTLGSFILAAFTLGCGFTDSLLSSPTSFSDPHVIPSDSVTLDILQGFRWITPGKKVWNTSKARKDSESEAQVDKGGERGGHLKRASGEWEKTGRSKCEFQTGGSGHQHCRGVFPALSNECGGPLADGGDGCAWGGPDGVTDPNWS